MWDTKIDKFLERGEIKQKTKLSESAHRTVRRILTKFWMLVLNVSLFPNSHSDRG